MSQAGYGPDRTWSNALSDRCALTAQQTHKGDSTKFKQHCSLREQPFESMQFLVIMRWRNRSDEAPNDEMYGVNWRVVKCKMQRLLLRHHADPARRQPVAVAVVFTMFCFEMRCHWLQSINQTVAVFSVIFFTVFHFSASSVSLAAASAPQTLLPRPMAALSSSQALPPPPAVLPSFVRPPAPPFFNLQGHRSNPVLLPSSLSFLSPYVASRILNRKAWASDLYMIAFHLCYVFTA